MSRAEIDLAEDLEAGRVAPAGFGHQDHLRVAWALLGPMGLGFAEAYGRLRRGLIALAERAGAPDKYSETLTLAWLSLVHEELVRSGRADDFEGFMAQGGDRLGRTAITARYGQGGLDHPAARAGLILPPIPEESRP